MRRGPPACEVLAGLWLCATSTASVPATSIKIVQIPFLTSYYSPVRHTASATPASGSGLNAQTRRPGYASADGLQVFSCCPSGGCRRSWSGDHERRQEPVSGPLLGGAPCKTVQKGIRGLMGRIRDDAHRPHHLVILVRGDVAVPGKETRHGTSEVGPDSRDLASVGDHGILQAGLARSGSARLDA